MRNIYISTRKFVGFSMAKDSLMYPPPNTAIYPLPPTDPVPFIPQFSLYSFCYPSSLHSHTFPFSPRCVYLPLFHCILICKILIFRSATKTNNGSAARYKKAISLSSPQESITVSHPHKVISCMPWDYSRMSLNGPLIREKMAVISVSGRSICNRSGLLIEGESHREGESNWWFLKWVCKYGIVGIVMWIVFTKLWILEMIWWIWWLGGLLLTWRYVTSQWFIIISQMALSSANADLLICWPSVSSFAISLVIKSYPPLRYILWSRQLHLDFTLLISHVFPIDVQAQRSNSKTRNVQNHLGISNRHSFGIHPCWTVLSDNNPWKRVSPV